MRIAALGCGSIGTRHLTTLNGMGERDLIIYDPDSSRVAAIANELRIAVSASIEELCASDPELVLVCTPTALHESNLRHLLKNTSAHIFVEKPAAHRLDMSCEILEEVEGSGRFTMVGCNMRFHPCLQEIKKIVVGGELGPLISARIEAGQYLPDWHPNEDYRLLYSSIRTKGGGCLLDYIHEIDYANWLFGQPRSVFASCGHYSQLEIDTEDAAELIVQFDAVPLVSIHVDYLQRAYCRGCKIVGEGGTVIWNIAERSVRLYLAATNEWSIIPEPDKFSFSQVYVDEMHYLLDCIRRGVRPMSDLREGYRAVEVVEAAKRSSSEGRKCDLPLAK